MFIFDGKSVSNFPKN